MAGCIIILLVTILYLVQCSYQQSAISNEQNTPPVLYDDYSLYKVFAENKLQMKKLLNLSSQYNGSIQPWLLQKTIGYPQDFVLAPADIYEVTQMWTNLGMKYRQTIPNIQQFIQYEVKQEDSPTGNKNCNLFDLRVYHSYSDIENQLQCLATRYKQFVQLKMIGSTYQNRPLFVVIINCSNSEEKNQKGMWIDGGFHAREWISPAVTMMILQKLVYQCQHRDPSVMKMSWFIAPVVNPDGYIYSRTQDRLWRKNRKQNHHVPNGGKRICQGVDLNRNFGYKWGSVVKGKNPCSEDYHGENEFSEPETQAVSRFLQQNREMIQAVLSLHSYGQIIIYPWDYTSKRRKVYHCVTSVASDMSGAMKSVNNRLYRFGQTHDVLYPASGTFTDWVVGSLGINLAYVLELPDKGDRGFLVSQAEIVPTFKEAWQAVNILREAVSNGLCQRYKITQYHNPDTDTHLDKQKRDENEIINFFQGNVSNNLNRIEDATSIEDSDLHGRLEDAVDQLLAAQPSEVDLQRLRLQDDPTTIRESRIKGDPSVHRIQITTRSPPLGSAFRNYSSKLGSHILICINCTNLVDKKFGVQSQAFHQIEDSQSKHKLQDDFTEDTKHHQMQLEGQIDKLSLPKQNQHVMHKKQYTNEQKIDKDEHFRQTFVSKIPKKFQKPSSDKSTVQRYTKFPEQHQYAKSKMPSRSSLKYRRNPDEQENLLKKIPKKSSNKNGGTQSLVSKISSQGPLKGQSVPARNLALEQRESQTPSRVVHSIMASHSDEQKSQQEPLRSRPTSVSVNSGKSNNNWSFQGKKLKNGRAALDRRSFQQTGRQGKKLKYEASLAGFQGKKRNMLGKKRRGERQDKISIRRSRRSKRGKQQTRTRKMKRYRKVVQIVIKKKRLRKYHQKHQAIFPQPTLNKDIKKVPKNNRNINTKPVVRQHPERQVVVQNPVLKTRTKRRKFYMKQEIITKQRMNPTEKDNLAARNQQHKPVMREALPRRGIIHYKQKHVNFPSYRNGNLTTHPVKQNQNTRMHWKKPMKIIRQKQNQTIRNDLRKSFSRRKKQRKVIEFVKTKVRIYKKKSNKKGRNIIKKQQTTNNEKKLEKQMQENKQKKGQKKSNNEIMRKNEKYPKFKMQKPSQRKRKQVTVKNNVIQYKLRRQSKTNNPRSKSGIQSNQRPKIIKILRKIKMHNKKQVHQIIIKNKKQIQSPSQIKQRGFISKQYTDHPNNFLHHQKHNRKLLHKMQQNQAQNSQKFRTNENSPNRHDHQQDTSTNQQIQQIKRYSKSRSRRRVNYNSICGTEDSESRSGLLTTPPHGDMESDSPGGTRRPSVGRGVRRRCGNARRRQTE